jgi:hypothetical protein
MRSASTASSDAGPGRDAFLAAVRSPGGRGGHRCSIEGDDVSAVADHHPEPVGGHPMPGHDDPARGGDVEELASNGWLTLTWAAASSGDTE